MALDDLGIVVLPREEVFPIGPGREAPNGWKATAINPYRRVIGRIARAEKCRNYLIEGFCRCGIRLADVDAIGRPGELEVVHRGGAENLAQLGHGDAPWLAPRLLDI